MSVFDDIKNGLRQAIIFEQNKRAIRSHLERAKTDVKLGKVQTADTAFTSVLDELERRDDSLSSLMR